METSPLLDNISFAEQGKKIKLRKAKTKKWLEEIANNYKKEIVSLNYTFCTDEELLEINKTYLNHDYYTDIITFDLSEINSQIEGDIYISIDRVKDNAKEHKVKKEIELYRVIAHGLLHLIGFKDKTQLQIKQMRKAESDALERWNKTKFHVEHK
jgi:rRNA maturation RNase YbeY